MITRIHHLDCCSLCPVGGRWLWGPKGRMCGHVLLLETASQGLVLVDTGVGLEDRDQRLARFGWFGLSAGFPTHAEGAAVRQIEALGLDPADVRHVVLTHFDLDHAGGICDVPHAQVHLLAAEREAAERPTRRERMRYNRAHVAAVRNWRPYAATGEAWFGFPAAQAVAGLEGEVVIVPLTGHSRGHAAIAVKRPEGGWLLHAGDAYFNRGTLDGRGSPGLFSTFEKTVAWDWARVQANHARLTELLDEPEVGLFSAHDPEELEALVRDD